MVFGYAPAKLAATVDMDLQLVLTALSQGRSTALAAPGHDPHILLAIGAKQQGSLGVWYPET